jgi:carboxypeptidase Taq
LEIRPPIAIKPARSLDLAVMKTVASLHPLTTRLVEIQQLSSAAALLGWDQETYMPPGGGLARAEQLATLQGLAHEKLVAPETEQLLLPWINPDTNVVLDAPDEPWDDAARALLREAWRDFRLAKKLPTEFVRRLRRTCSVAQQVWQEARAKDNFCFFLPHLRTIVSLKQEEAQYRGYADSPYDALLDLYEPGLTVSSLRPLFAVLKSRLVSLLQRVLSSDVQLDDALLFQAYDAAGQLEFGRHILMAMGYDFERGRLDLSAHPFTTSFHPNDVRVTTRVHERELPVCLFGCLHEGGHGLYDQGLNPEYYGTPLGESLSLGIHESQSRLWENCIGRSIAFWRGFYPLLQRSFADQLGDVPLERFYAAINRVKPSLIRVEADELTYNLHIMVRFEIEMDLIEGRSRVEDLPDLWRESMQSYLGIAPDRDADGVLQDVHWSLGAFGYFPTYTVGNLFAVQFYEQARRDIAKLEKEIEQGHLTMLTNWLREKIHRWGRQFTADQLARRVTGQPLTPEPFLSYLEAKFGALYRLS